MHCLIHRGCMSYAPERRISGSYDRKTRQSLNLGLYFDWDIEEKGIVCRKALLRLKGVNYDRRHPKVRNAGGQIGRRKKAMPIMALPFKVL